MNPVPKQLPKHYGTPSTETGTTCAAPTKRKRLRTHIGTECTAPHHANTGNGAAVKAFAANAGACFLSCA